MQFSKYNIFSKLKNSEDYFIVNLLSGNADIVNTNIAKEWLKGNYVEKNEMIEKGYLVDENDERNLLLTKYKEYLERREEEEIQLFFVPTYKCNFTCKYCYQNEYIHPEGKFDKPVIDSFFKFVDENFNNKKYYITLFGGEPLLKGENYRENLSYFLKQATKRGIEIAIVTNGYNLEEYFFELNRCKIREIQVTIDGPQEMHDRRRIHKDGAPTFEKISQAIDKLLLYGIPINLRFVADKENINTLPYFAKYCIEKGWTSSSLFKTQIGRNYELHYCQESREILFSRLSLYEELYNLIKVYPYILEFHKPAFSISRFLFENEELPEPLFDACPACKTEWAFDYSGKIYSCTATVGKNGEELGTFHPKVKLNTEEINQWKKRDIFNIKECVNCNVNMACGGGCGSVAKNKTGEILSPDCRPIKELLELGISLYFQKS